MKTNARFKYILKDLMRKKSLDEIKVAELCEKCECNRQTFYYYYRDVLDLYTEVILSEKIDEFRDAKTIEASAEALLKFTVENFEFLKNAFNGGAANLTADYFSGILMEKMLSLHSTSAYKNEDIEIYRIAVRRYCKYVANEFSYYFVDTLIETKSYEKQMKRFLKYSQQHVLPAMIDTVNMEKNKNKGKTTNTNK